MSYLIMDPVVKGNSSQGKSGRKRFVEGLQNLPETLIRTGWKDKVGIHGLPVVRNIVHLVICRCDDAKVAAGAANGPEEVGILRLGCLHHIPIRGHHSDRLQSVEHEATMALKGADATTQRGSNDSYAFA